MRAFSLFICILLIAACPLFGQVDFFGRPISGQSPNSASTFLLLGIANETSLVNSAFNLKDFDHASRQINLFNLGIRYATEVLQIDTLEEVEIDLDTVINGSINKNTFRFYAGMQYELADRETSTTGIIGSSRFRDGGLSIALRHEMSLLPEDRTFRLVYATARDQSVFASVFGGVEAGFDTGFSISLEESGILELITNHLVRDVAEGELTFDEYKSIESQLHQGMRYQAPRNTGGSEWYFLFTLKGEIYSTPLRSLPLRFSLGLDFGLDVMRIRKRNQNRLALSFKVGYLLF